MKKSILALTLPLIIYGCSDNNNAPIGEKFANFEKNYITATNAIVSESSEYSLGTIAYTAELNQINDKVTLKDSFDYTEQQNGVVINYDLTSDAEVNLDKYNAKDGIATFTGKSQGNLAVEVSQTGDVVLLKDIFANANYSGELNEKSKSLNYTAQVASNTVPLLVSDTQVAELGLTDLNSTVAISFDDTYNKVKSFKSGFEGKGLTLKVVGPLAEEVDMTAEASKLVSSSEYVASPLKYGTIASVGSLNVKGKSGAESIDLTLGNIEVKTSLNEANNLISANLGYNIGETRIIKDQSPALDFGAFFINTDVKGLNKTKDWKEFLETVNQFSSQDPSNLDEEDAAEILKTFAEILSKDTRFESVIENKLTIGDALKIEFAFQPSESFVSVLKQGPDAIESAFANKSPVELIDTHISEFKFKGTVTEGYLISQYEKVLTLNGQDASKAANEVKGGIQMVMMLVTMQTAPLGVSPVQFQEGKLFIDVAYKNGQWNINGTTLTTAQIFAAFQ